MITKLKIPINLPVLFGALSIAVVVANLLQIITAGSNQQAVLWAVLLGSVVASLGYFVQGDVKSYKRILALTLALTCAVGDGLSNANPVFVIGFVLSIAVLVGFSSGTLKTYFTTSPSAVAIMLFIPLALMHSSLVSLVSITALSVGEARVSYSHEAGIRSVERQWQAQRGVGTMVEEGANMVIANTWEETVRVGMYLAGIQNPVVNTALWAAMHRLPDRALLPWLHDTSELTKKLISIGFLVSISLVGVVILRVFVLTKSFWSILILHLLFNFAGPQILTTHPGFVISLLAVFFLSLIWIHFQLKYLESLSKKVRKATHA